LGWPVFSLAWRGKEHQKMSGENRTDRGDPLRRFTSAQEGVYERALDEIRNGRKETHWIWFIFPQIDGLGSSSTSKRYAIRNRGEAQSYLSHPVLGPRLCECAEAVLAVEGRTASEIFGYPDDLKLRSSMTLFAAATEPGSVFERVLERYYQGKPDRLTLDILKKLEQKMS
jgi:uncharacterized protein (DUF1810 family)